jgi:hypothetical protein
VTKLLQVECRCGAIQLSISGDPSAQFFCHCDDCQALHGAAYVPEAVYPAEAVRVTRGSPYRWTFKRNPREGCPACGTRLFIDVLRLNLRGVNGYLFPAGEFEPTFHMFCQYAVCPVRDDLPHYKARPLRFGGSDELVGW